MEELTETQKQLAEVLELQRSHDEKKRALHDEGEAIKQRLVETRERLALHYKEEAFLRVKDFLELFRGSGPVGAAYAKVQSAISGLEANCEDYTRILNAETVPAELEFPRQLLTGAIKPGTGLGVALKRIAEVGGKHGLFADEPSTSRREK